MSLIGKIAALAVVGLLASLALPSQGRAFARARHRIATVQQWHLAQVELQILTMDFPEAAEIWEPVLERMNREGFGK